MYRETIRQSIADIVEPFLQTQGFELVELQLQQRKGQWLVRVFADAEGGISLDDCRRLSLDTRTGIRRRRCYCHFLCT